MLSLLVFPLRFLYSMGISGALVTLCAGAVALLMLPALLIVLGPRIDALSPGWLRAHAARSARATADGGWWKLSNAVVRRPAPIALLAAAVLILAAAPAAGVRFTSPAAKLLPPNAESNEVETALARDFPLNSGEATEIVMHGSRASVDRLAAQATLASRGLASTAPPNYVGRGTWRITLFPHGSPYSNIQQRLLSRLGAITRPYGALVGGASAFFADQKAAIAASIPIALLILVPLTASFLFAMTGSFTIPVKALAMNALSVGAAVGLQVLIFQDGHLSGLLGFKPIGGLEESSLVLMVVLTFALATDYEVFVLARVKEAHDAGLPNRSDRPWHRAHRTHRHRRRAALLCRDRRAGDLRPLLHQADRPRRRARGRGRREHRQSTARARPDGPDGRLELVGAGAAAPPARAHRAGRGRPGGRWRRGRRLGRAGAAPIASARMPARIGLLGLGLQPRRAACVSAGRRRRPAGRRGRRARLLVHLRHRPGWRGARSAELSQRMRARCRPTLSPLQLLDAADGLERRARARAGRISHGPRAIDIDVLLLGDLELQRRAHDAAPCPLASRRFVLVPALELDFQARLPDGTRLSDALALLPLTEGVRWAGPPLATRGG